ncbi:MAG: ComEC/Rec2 family competence protein [Lachnospiraceae bacterium]|nr:ComEC/Rec2 family competence protein [Lachnospiraceae bacterium]
MKRPLAVSCGYFLLGLIAARATVENKIVAISILALGILGLYISNRITKVKFVVLLLFLFETLGFATGFGFFQAGSTQADLAYTERSAVQMDLMLISMKKSEYGYSLQGKNEEGRFLITTNSLGDGQGSCLEGDGVIRSEMEQDGEPGRICPGQWVTVEGYLSRPKQATNPGCFDARHYYETQGIKYQIKKAKVTYCDSHLPNYLRLILYKLRWLLSASLASHFEEPYTSLMQAMLLGEKDNLSPTYQLLFQKGGIAHVLAISGLHVALLAGILEWILTRLGLQKKSIAISSIIFLFLYGMMTGFAAATLRAVLMLSLRQVALLLKRRSDLLTTTVLTFTIMAILNPETMFSLGTLMSFCAVLGVFVSDEIYRAIFRQEHFRLVKESLRQYLKRMIKAMLLMATINTLMLPILIHSYYEIPTYSMLVNILVIPTMTLVIALGIAAALLGLPGLLYTSLFLGNGLTPPFANGMCAHFICKIFSPFVYVLNGLADLVTRFASYGLHGYAWLCQESLKLPFSRISPGHENWLMLIGFYLIFLLLLLAFLAGAGQLEERILGPFRQVTGWKLVRKVRSGGTSSGYRPPGLLQKIREMLPRAREQKIHRSLLRGQWEFWGRVRLMVFYFAGLLFMAASFLSLTAWRNYRRSQVVFADVGQGDGSLIHVKKGGNYLVDGGSSSEDKLGRYVLIPVLKYYGMSHIDGIFISHTDKDHYSGILYILQNANLYGIQIDHLIFAEGTEEDEAMKSLLAAAQNVGAEIDYMSAGDQILDVSGNAEFTCVYPEGVTQEERGEMVCNAEDGMEGMSQEKCAYEYADKNAGQEIERKGNDYSLVLRADIRGLKHNLEILYTGDISEVAESLILESPNLKGGDEKDLNGKDLNGKDVNQKDSQEISKGAIRRILKVPHHGSRFSSSKPFLYVLSQYGYDQAVISVGEHNIYGHPSKDALKRLEKAGFEIHRTDWEGAVVLE